MIKEEDIKVGLKFCLRLKCLNGKYTKRLDGALCVYTITGIYNEHGKMRAKAFFIDTIRGEALRFETNLPLYSFIDKEFSERNEYILATIVQEDNLYKNDNVSQPSYYAWLKDLCGVEPLDICRHLDFNVGNALKYLLRKDKVDGNKTKVEKRIEDLKKAFFYIEDEIKLLEYGKENV